MKYLFAAVLLASSVAGFSAANAAEGCGPGFHRGPYGGCRPNGREVIVAVSYTHLDVYKRQPIC